jgi:3-dehydroquinate dehydratase II
VKNRVEVMHGVNFDVLQHRNPDVYGGLKLTELEIKIRQFALELGLATTFSQTNHEGEYCESLHRAPEHVDALVLNPGAWTHYSYAIRDALEVSGLPAVEVHISEVASREDWRSRSVIRDLCVGVVEGKGVDGYREALQLIKEALGR